MLHQLRLFFTALQFFTRLPVPRWVGYQPEWLQQSSRYFPLVGVVVAGICAALYIVASWLLPPHVAVLLARSIDGGNRGGVKTGGLQIGEQRFQRGDEQARRLFGFAGFARGYDHRVVLETETEQTRVVPVRQRSGPQTFAGPAVQ